MDGELIGTIYDHAHYGEIEIRLGTHLSGKPALWIRDPYLENTVAVMSIDEPKIALEEGEFLVLPRKCFKRMIDPILQLGVVEDTGQRLRIEFQSAQIWKVKK